MTAKSIGFVGAGQMARALARGFVAAELFEAAQILASDPSETARDEFSKIVSGASTSMDNKEVAARADVIVLAVKPQLVDTVLAEIAGSISDRQLVVSIAAGVSLTQLAASLGEQTRLVRVMPNTPCLISQGASAFCIGGAATDIDAELVEMLLSSVGRVFRLQESLMDAVTGLSGSGPAFVCLLVEALSDGGVRMGLPRDVASTLASQMVAGTALMILATGEHPAILKDRVASPGGTTIAGLEALESHSFRAALIAAVEAATKRSAELGNG
ncbi:MAG: pyrroline-5-carboxylate reductase [Pirellulales bacterium]